MGLNNEDYAASIAAAQEDLVRAWAGPAVPPGGTRVARGGPAPRR